jgi:hypothetical protein
MPSSDPLFIIPSTFRVQATNAPDTFSDTVTLAPGTTTTVDNGALTVIESIVPVGGGSQDEWLVLNYATTNGQPLSQPSQNFALNAAGLDLAVPAEILAAYQQYTDNGTALTPTSSVFGNYSIAANPVPGGAGTGFLDNTIDTNEPAGPLPAGNVFINPFSYLSSTGINPSQVNGIEEAVEFAPQAAINPTSLPVYRFFDTIYGTHLFTASQAEALQVAATRTDLVQEINNFRAVSSTSPSAEPVYRFFETANGTHFYTASQVEYNALTTPGSGNYRPDLSPEPSATFYEDQSPQAGDVPVYRLFDSVHGTQFLTGSQTEYTGLTTPGSGTYRPDLKPEGIDFYAPAGSFHT